MFKDIIELITYTKSGNSAGDTIKTPVPKEVFADKKSIRQSEFYQAAASGLKPELMFVIRAEDYNGETALKYEDNTYRIIRTYVKGSEFMELVCQGVVNGVK